MMDSIDTFNQRVASIKQQLHTLYHPDDAVIWLITPHPRLSGRQPVDLLWSEDGHRRVNAILQQVLDGAFI